MATVSAVVFAHHEKTDGTYNVKIRIYHKNERKFIDTSHFVNKRQLDSKRQIKDKFLKKLIEETLEEYRDTISNLGSKLEFFSAEELRNYIRDKDSEVDFVKFCSEHIAQLRKEKRNGTANNHRIIRNS